MTFRAAVVQDSPVLFDLKLTIDKVETITKEASTNGASLVVFPEAFISAYPKGLNFGAKWMPPMDKTQGVLYGSTMDPT